MKKSLLVFPVVALLALTGCSGSDKSAQIGEPLNVKITAGDTRATIEVTVAEIASTPTADVPEIEFDGDFANGELFMVQYSAKLVKGNFESSGAYFFSDKKWAARGSEDIATVSTGFFNDVEVPGCEMFTSDHAKMLSEGTEIEACQLFVSAGKGASIDQVVYGQPQISRRGGGGWKWSVE